MNTNENSLTAKAKQLFGHQPQMPIFNLTPGEKRFWEVLISMKTREWEDGDNYIASQLCRDFATMERIARLNSADHLLELLCKRTNESARILNLDPARCPAELIGQQRNIVTAVVLAV